MQNIRKRFYSFLPGLILASSVVLLSACESRWEKMHDDELAVKSNDCARVANPGGAMAQVCKNIERECKRRRSVGVYAC